MCGLSADANAVGAPGGVVSVGVALTTIEPVAGFSFGLRNDPVVASLQLIEPGPAISAVNDGDGPDFFGTQLLAVGGLQCLLLLSIHHQLQNELL